MNFEKFTIKSQEALQKSAEIALAGNQQAIEPAHLLKAILETDENVTQYLFKKLNVNASHLETKLSLCQDAIRPLRSRVTACHVAFAYQAGRPCVVLSLESAAFWTGSRTLFGREEALTARANFLTHCLHTKSPTKSCDNHFLPLTTLTCTDLSPCPSREGEFLGHRVNLYVFGTTV